MIKDMEKAMSVIQTGISMRGNSREVRRTGKEFTTGQEGRFTMVNGKME